MKFSESSIRTRLGETGVRGNGDSHESMLVRLQEVQRQAENVEAFRKQLKTLAQAAIASSNVATIETLGDAEVRFSDPNTGSKAQTDFSPEVREAMTQVLREKERLNLEIQSIIGALRGLNDHIQELIICRRIQRSMNRAPRRSNQKLSVYPSSIARSENVDEEEI